MAKHLDNSSRRNAPLAKPASPRSMPSASKAQPPPAKKPSTVKVKSSLQLASRDRVGSDLFANFGENLKAARLHSGLKQADIAKQAGLTQQRLSTIEAGQQNLTLRTMVRLADAVGLTVSDMLLKSEAREKE
jgi:DNA-binding XRE family transcriptional regulator